MNTLCPKVGAAQWTCTPAECNCHVNRSARRRQQQAERLLNILRRHVRVEDEALTDHDFVVTVHTRYAQDSRTG
jgi:hypothetical protein